MNMPEYKRNSYVPLYIYIYMPYIYILIYTIYIYIHHIYIYTPYIYIYTYLCVYICIHTQIQSSSPLQPDGRPPLHRCHLGYNLLRPPSYPSNLPPPLDGNAGVKLGPGSPTSHRKPPLQKRSHPKRGNTWNFRMKFMKWWFCQERWEGLQDFL